MAEVRVPAATDIEQAAYAFDAALAAGDRRTLLEARLALCAALAADGWQAPPEVKRQIDYDAFELRQMDAEHRTAQLV
jgi:hypothetical protein